MSIIKRLLLGRPLASEEAQHQLLPKILALPVFASDALSSVAYATEEILLVLILAGTASLSASQPIALAVVVLMFIVVSSYRQTVRAYPRGGGGYLVTRENIGTIPSLAAAGALLAAYVLTVAVSMSAGSLAVVSFIPSLLPHKVTIALVFLAVITVMNLRGAKESGALFAGPTYAFVLSIMVMIAVGIFRCATSSCPAAVLPEEVQHVGMQTLTLFLFLRAFASGATALTGVEAIADGVQAFRGRRPIEQAHNAAATLAALLVISSTMFVGITFLANRMGALPSEEKTVVAQIADGAFGGGAGFFIVQIATALILILAANTAYQDFPRLSSILAKDRFMPRQFINRGDKLVFSNGILVLTALSAALIVVYGAAVSRLIALYLVGVFTTFTLAQSGMVMRWRRLREPATWRRRAAFNGIGAFTTGVVLLVVVTTRWSQGTWIMLIAIPLIVLWLLSVNRHYRSVAMQLRKPEYRPFRAIGTRVLVLVPRVEEATMRALGYARALRPLEVQAVHVGGGDDAQLIRKAWEERRLSVPLEILEGSPDSLIEPIRRKIRSMTSPQDEFVTVVVPEVLSRSRLQHLVDRRRTQILKAALLFERRVAVTDIPTPAEENIASPRGMIAPARTVAVVLVSAVHNATLQALEYARALSPTDLRAVVFNVEPEETARVIQEWSETDVDVPLEAEDSPFREVGRPLLRYVRKLRQQHPDSVVSVIIPEFVVRKWWHQFLHNQTALSIKAALLFEPGVVVTSIPFHLE
ncbi:MAG TPA: APC family permease [Actinomycetota bacterium]